MNQPKRLALSTFAKWQKVAKSTVYRQAKLMQLDTSNGLTYEQCCDLSEILESDLVSDVIEYFVEDAPNDVKSASQLTITPVSVETPSNEASMIPGSFSLDSVLTRFDMAAVDKTNTEQIVHVVTQMYNAAESALTQRVTEQQNTLNLTQNALQQVQAIHQDKSTDLKLKALESKILANQQVTTTNNLQDLLKQVAALGNG